MSNVEMRLTELERRVANIVRPGTVEEADYDAARVRVRIGAVITAFLPWLTRRAGGDADWWAPEVGEQVMVFAPSGELGQAVVMPALYSDAAPAPSDSPDIRAEVYGDGFKVTHDRANKTTVFDAWDSEGTLELRAKNIILKTGDLGFYHVGHFGYATRITHLGGVEYQTESWSTGINVTGLPDHGHNPPEVTI